MTVWQRSDNQIPAMSSGVLHEHNIFCQRLIHFGHSQDKFLYFSIAPIMFYKHLNPNVMTFVRLFVARPLSIKSNYAN